MEKDFVEAIPVVVEGLKQLAPYATIVPVGAIGRAFLGQATAEVAELLADIARHYRYKAVEWLFPKAEKIIEDAGFEPRAVPPKILFSIIEGASFETHHDMQARWARLLANASHPVSGDAVRPSFVKILAQMAIDEARMLSWIHEHGVHGYVVPTKEIISACSSTDEPGVILDSLESAQLIRRGDFSYIATMTNAAYPPDFLGAAVMPTSRAARFNERKDKSYVITDLGRAFVKICELPAT